MELLSSISFEYVKTGLEEPESDTEETGDNILTMLLKPSYTTQVHRQ